MSYVFSKFIAISLLTLSLTGCGPMMMSMMPNSNGKCGGMMNMQKKDSMKCSSDKNIEK